MSVLTVSADVLRYATAIAQTPEGIAAVIALGGPAAGLIVKFGTLGLSAVLSTWTGPTITDEDLDKALAEKGLRVQPIDLEKLYG
jgi:hypothetical protein